MLSQEKAQSIKALPSGPGAAAFKSGVKESDARFQRISSRPSHSRRRRAAVCKGTQSGARAGPADPGNAVLPGEYAGPLQHAQRLGHGAAGALGLLGDPLVRREAGAGAAVVEAPTAALGVAVQRGTPAGTDTFSRRLIAAPAAGAGGRCSERDAGQAASTGTRPRRSS